MPDSQFPASLWPGVPVDPLPVRRLQATITDAGFMVWEGSDGDSPPTELPLELALRELLEVKIDDRHAVVDLVNNFGSITARFSGLTVDVARDIPNGVLANHLADVCAHLVQARALARQWIAYMKDDYLLPAWAEAEVFGFPVPIGEDGTGVWSHWADWLNRGLQSFHVRAEVAIDFAPDVAVGRPLPDLFAGLCLQIYNLAVEGHDPRRCPSEDCGSWFVRQRGGVTAGQYRLAGVTYCSPRCARAQGQRERRRRSRERTHR